ncbi:MAG TPA: hypothetical protein VHN81_00110, partial [Edaphobacter sp.]|nr:hypothetical protein [Edaphobacter sp.]
MVRSEAFPKELPHPPDQLNRVADANLHVGEQGHIPDLDRTNQLKHLRPWRPLTSSRDQFLPLTQGQR